jgi:ubiquinone/menaquinone biosynthesis C-methylase UbiE
MKLNWIERVFVNSPLRLAIQHLEINWFQSIMPLEPGAQILEIGCGRGAGARLILDHFKPAHLYLMDVDPAMIQKAGDHLNSNYQNTVSFCVGNATALPLADQSMDAAFGFGFLHHVMAWRNSLIETARVLKIGGIYYMVEYYPSLYQNFVTKRILSHPERDRFSSRDLRKAFIDVDIALNHTFELKRWGILGVGIKTEKGAAAGALKECRLKM